MEDWVLGGSKASTRLYWENGSGGSAKNSLLCGLELLEVSMGSRMVTAFDLWQGWAIICKEGVSKAKIIQSWVSPSQGLMKLNFNGSSLGNPGEAGIGGLCRNDKGEVLWAYSGPIGVADSNEAEVRAVHSGIKFLDSQVYDSSIVEGDSLNVIRWLSGEVAPPWRFLPFFKEIEDLIQGSSIVFGHVRRSANAEADSLARGGVFRTILECFDYFPP
ncbi:uncharacterized protein LOC143849470 [Tasmannia lanceolata]|uniref:uncharacterized protein LOC143849470 n=1 Tax=Tasmannia lanceolata TaxID=3420 RepID=UPI004063D567